MDGPRGASSAASSVTLAALGGAGPSGIVAGDEGTQAEPEGLRDPNVQQGRIYPRP